ncbi:MAG TPA: hypothetical protein VFU12_12395 [Glycomyces sp.]|nr:hypothetical protein [Glycomyces sp.]
MADREPYSTDDKDAFEWIDDMEQSEQPVEDAILDADDYEGADRYGTTPAEERRGVPLEEELASEEPDVPSASVSDEWREGPDPRAGTLVDDGELTAEETSDGDADLGEIHVTEDDRDRAGSMRESWEEGPPPDPEAAAALDEDRDPEPEPDDWR